VARGGGLRGVGRRDLGLKGLQLMLMTSYVLARYSYIFIEGDTFASAVVADGRFPHGVSQSITGSFDILFRIRIMSSKIRGLCLL
jgi:hypothetical protein